MIMYEFICMYLYSYVYMSIRKYISTHTYTHTHPLYIFFSLVRPKIPSRHPMLNAMVFS